jgi:hypothetical protein
MAEAVDGAEPREAFTSCTVALGGDFTLIVFVAVLVIAEFVASLPAGHWKGASCMV